ncbi:class F sortase [Couchioplanes azureus]|uniref:class F sortase n=1 Tax=Couchioplanes caeruleus TaxID=56438 RepID=UPI00167083DA|nr:class F sortase [Couchioplanes caeruleus]
MPESVLRRRPAEITARSETAARPETAARAGTARPVPPASPVARLAVTATPSGAMVPPRRLPPPPHAPGRPLRDSWRRRRLPAPSPVRGRRPMPLGMIAAVLVFVGLFALGAGVGAATGFDVRDLFRGPDKPPPRDFPVLDPSPPKRLMIPAIKVEAPVLPVGLAKDGSVDVPPPNRNETGWFGEGPTPGQFGPALIVGHVDTDTRPGVFHQLRNLRPGQRIEVLREDDETAVFQVNSVERFGKARLPVQRVYGDYSRPSLRLVTCGGTWLGAGRGYADNVIVFASLIGTKQRH